MKTNIIITTRWPVLLLLSGLLLLLVLASLHYASDLTLGETLSALVGKGNLYSVFLIQELRLPRILTAVFSGMALGVAGCLLQTLARNRLATPNIIGLDNGATAFAVASVVAVPVSLATPALALVGAATAAALAFGLSGGPGTQGYRFIVMGVGVGAVFGALTNFMLARADMDSANVAYPWTVGSLNARSEEVIVWLGLALLFCLPLALYLARSLNVMRLSDAVATGLGVHIRRTRWLTLTVTVVLTGFAVALAGPVGMIALAAPEIARRLIASGHVPVPEAALTGSCLMLLADGIGQHAFSPIEIPVGLVTALVGGPYLLWILLRQPGGKTL
ncbi:FecCD family ABC transporter permease [Thiopseudomonas denitrificans]|uniref:Iron complex transport system permease protein n=1 Tax=Thiopseudomonas denitrificans TaxID=1501432 RepID=A0A4R6U1W0_9GAMM|nr:iron chelate uptake ABC transporter family permease subunit [Thiopseudomonas denitrificans]TDQ39606.1 iron complex transport system permease protein [Thiopseudomonas denitrificans]